LGADKFITKPQSPESLLAQIQQVFDEDSIDKLNAPPAKPGGRV